MLIEMQSSPTPPSGASGTRYVVVLGDATESPLPEPLRSPFLHAATDKRGGPLSKRVVWEGSCWELFGCAGGDLSQQGDGGQEDHLRERVRRVLGLALKDARAQGLSTVEVWFARSPSFPLEEGTLLEIAGETITLASYTFETRYPGGPFPPRDAEDGHVHSSLPERCHVGFWKQGENIARNDVMNHESLDRGTMRGRAVNFARLLGDLPSNALPPRELAREISARLAGLVQCRTLHAEDLEREGLRGILAVGGGSRHGPCLLVAE